MIDNDRDGIIGSDDLAAIYNSIGTSYNYLHFSFFTLEKDNFMIARV